MHQCSFICICTCADCLISWLLTVFTPCRLVVERASVCVCVCVCVCVWERAGTRKHFSICLFIPVWTSLFSAQTVIIYHNQAVYSEVKCRFSFTPLMGCVMLSQERDVRRQRTTLQKHALQKVTVVVFSEILFSEMLLCCWNVVFPEMLLCFWNVVVFLKCCCVSEMLLCFWNVVFSEMLLCFWNVLFVFIWNVFNHVFQHVKLPYLLRLLKSLVMWNAEVSLPSGYIPWMFSTYILINWLMNSFNYWHMWR